MLPVENPARGSWAKAAVGTFAQVVRRPLASFRTCREPVAHGVIIRYLASLRLPLWGVLVAALAGTAMGTGPVPQRLIPVHGFIDPSLTRVLSLWVVLMVPLGLPILYFVTGLTAHLSVSLTGGAPRSIGATMRAVGFSLGPALLLLGILDLPLYLGQLDGGVYLGVLAGVGLWFLWQAGTALALTHQVPLVRGFLVALIPAVIVVGVAMARALLVLHEVPLLPPPSASPYYIP